jgi:hypothetical protein
MLKYQEHIATADQDKAKILFSYYSELFATTLPRVATIKWDIFDI